MTNGGGSRDLLQLPLGQIFDDDSHIGDPCHDARLLPLVALTPTRAVRARDTRTKLGGLVAPRPPRARGRRRAGAAKNFTPGFTLLRASVNRQNPHRAQISTTDRTHARTGPDTQRAQAHCPTAVRNPSGPQIPGSRSGVSSRSSSYVRVRPSWTSCWPCGGAPKSLQNHPAPSPSPSTLSCLVLTRRQACRSASFAFRPGL